MMSKMFKNVKNYDKTHKNLILGYIVCGNSRHLIYIRAEYPKWELYGYDKSEFSRNNLKKNNFNLIDNLENIPGNFFDIINLSSVIEHLKYPILDITLLKKK